MRLTRNIIRIVIAILIAFCLIIGIGGCSWLNGKNALTATSPSSQSGIETIDIDDLPSEAVITLGLIQSGGPFPYEKDGSVFHNYEGLLPEQSDGYYREYTVETPGASDRGARRIVSGADGKYYYTDDHYASF
ncbi:MAG: ribonuclease N, partial [Dehalococcoidia bacterium]|nr:ribonuclease N [Dehalococcoidia bacterium]